MATYYKYAERSADSQVNWAQVGKGISDMLNEGVKIREEKKAAYEEAYRIDTERLVNAPQGTWQDGNATVNNFAHDMMAQQLIDYRLLKSGVMNERDYTLRRENYKSGTNTVFDLQKILQENRASTIDAYNKGEIQALNVSNMADVEAYTDFTNAKIDIDPYNPNINMSIYETKMVDGKEVRVLKKTSPVNVLKGQLLQKVPAFKLDEAVTKDVDALGVDSEFIYEAASVMRAGSITKLIGYGAIAGEYAKKDKDGNSLYPEFADSIKRFDNAIEQTINKYFSNPYNVSSVLTENTGKYSAESYTVSKEEAEKDKTKLLKKLDPMTGLYVLDKDGPHYKEQEQEAREYVKKIILGKLDSKRELATTAQTQLQERRPETEAQRGDRESTNVVSNVAKLYYGTDEDVTEASDFLRSFNPTIDFIDRSGDNIKITYNDGRPPEIRPWKSEGGSMLDQTSWVTANTNFFLPENKRIGNIKEIVSRGGIDKSRQFNPDSKGFSAGSKFEPTESVDEAYKRVIAEDLKIEPKLFVADNDSKTKANLSGIIAGLPGLKGITLDTGVSGDRLILKEGKSEIARFELDDMTDEQAQQYTVQLLELAASRASTEQKGLKIQGRRAAPKATERTSTRAGAATSNLNATQRTGG